MGFGNWIRWINASELNNVLRGARDRSNRRRTRFQLLGKMRIFLTAEPF
jgi:hypothetical protein